MKNGYYKINDKLKMFSDLYDKEHRQEYIKGKYKGYIYVKDDFRHNNIDDIIWGELLINNNYYKRGWIQRCCIGDEITEEEWEVAYGNRNKRKI